MVPVLRYLKIVSKVFVILIVLFVISTYHNRYVHRQRIRNFHIWKMNVEIKEMKYILIWSKDEPDLEVLKTGQEAFAENGCLHRNCYVTKERNLSNIVYSHFDAVIISGRNITELPFKRYPDQAFIFASKESADNYPMCDSKYDNFFNWTWTYRLSSDIVWTYFTVLNKEGKKIAPSPNVKWVRNSIKFTKKMGETIMSTKIYPAAWFASNCYTRSNRESFFLKLRYALKLYGLEVDVVGTCGSKKCPIEIDKDCVKVLRRYYFYFAFENSFAEDYVTEKVLKGLLHYTVPVVFGGADYSRFLPPGSYINGRELGSKQTATLMADLILNHTAYLKYLQWHNHYTIDNTYQQSICTLCEWVNKGVKKVHKHFRKWWNPPNETCVKRTARSSLRSKPLGRMLGSTCSVDDIPNVGSPLRDARVYEIINLNK